MTNKIPAIKKMVRAANYISAAQIYLQSNVLLHEPFSPDNIKPRLLGHWGTCPGVNFIYANLNAHIKEHKDKMLFVIGPGHGFPALQANLYIEGTLEKYYPKATEDEMGLAHITEQFSWPYGFPSHSNPGAPGAILEGGELGYALSTSYGAALDNPDLVVACVIGDGEAETGPTATAWHLNKLIDPKGNGAVLPIVHLNGYKISGPTLYGRMSNEDLTLLFTGYGYIPIIVDGSDGDACIPDVYEVMEGAVTDAMRIIRNVQAQARSDEGFEGVPKMPVIILRTPKGWTGIEELHREKIMGNALSHQVVGTNVKTDADERALLEAWLRSYNFGELFDAERGFCDEIKSIIPEPEFAMGDNDIAFGGERAMHELILPEATKFAEDASVPGTIGSSSMRRAGLYLEEVFRLNKDAKNFRLFSPDETYSNKLHAVFNQTKRAWIGRIEEWDKDLASDGRVMEMLSEHTLQGLISGYTLTGRYGVFASYEAFIQVVASMADQYVKFLKASEEYPWRGDVPSLNYFLTSSGWRQEHNGFSHQNPGFITDMLQKNDCNVRVFFPPCGNSTLVVLRHMLELKNGVNILVAGKTQEPRWLTPELAELEYKEGLAIWDFASEENPDVVFSAAGDYLTKEALAALEIVKMETPLVRVRFVNIMELSSMGFGPSDCASPIDFEHYFTEDKPVIFNFHGYPQTMQQVLFRKGDGKRFTVHGYMENGSTTTPYDMQIRNKTSRWHLAIDAWRELSVRGVIEQAHADELIQKYEDKLASHRSYIIKHGVDPEEIENWTWNGI